MHSILISATAGYLLGSIPFGYLLVRTFRGSDVRTTGSGNIGATNVARTSRALGITTLLLDVLKGAAAVWIAHAMLPNDRIAGSAAAFAAICGHVFPIWLRFRGGKGVATGLGAFALLMPKAVLLAIGIFIVLMLAFRYVSVASIMSAASLPLFAVSVKAALSPIEFLLVFLASLIIVLKHHRNIRRLMAGAEPKFQMSRK
jgi:acyl phosphate:glycerol-3-phosphate acyltransferase